MKDEQRVRGSLQRIADGAPTPSDLREAIHRRVSQRRRRAVAFSVAVAAVVGFASAVALDAVDNGARVEVVPSVQSTNTTSTGEHVATSTTPVTEPPSAQVRTPTVVLNRTEWWIATSMVDTKGCPMPLPAPPCDTTEQVSPLVLVPPGTNEAILLPRSAIGQIDWIVVDAPRERIFFGVTSGCDPGVNGTWMIGFDGVTPRKLSESGSRPAVSPDGRFIAYSEHTDGCGSRRLVVQEIESGRRFTYEAAVLLWSVAWVDDGAGLLVSLDAPSGVLRFPISETGAIADPEPVEGLDQYRIVDSGTDTELLARVCSPEADCNHWLLSYALARDGVIERQIPCPGDDCARPGEPRLGPNGTEVLWVSTDAAAWGVERALGVQEILPHTSDDGFVLLTPSGMADW